MVSAVMKTNEGVEDASHGSNATNQDEPTSTLIPKMM